MIRLRSPVVRRKAYIMACLGIPFVIGVGLLARAPVYAAKTPIFIQENGSFTGRLVAFSQ